MTAITRPISSSKGYLRPFDVRRDLNAVANLVERCFADTLDEDGRRYIQQMHAAARNPGYLFWASAIADRVSLPLSGFVWEQNDYLVGNLSLIPFFSRGRRLYLIANVAVDSGYRRRGIARALTVAALEYIRNKGAHAVWLHVREENLPALSLYQSLGFQERTRRTTWESSLGPEGARVTEMMIAPSGVRVASRHSHFWPQERAWLEQTYPPEITWQQAINLNAMRPGIWGGLYRLLTGIPIQQWAALQYDHLLGVLIWQPEHTHADNLWLATSTDHEENAIRALFPHMRKHLARRRRLILEYPAGRATQALQEAGFHAHQTLIWMEIKLRE